MITRLFSNSTWNSRVVRRTTLAVKESDNFQGLEDDIGLRDIWHNNDYHTSCYARTAFYPPIQSWSNCKRRSQNRKKLRRNLVGRSTYFFRYSLKWTLFLQHYANLGDIPTINEFCLNEMKWPFIRMSMATASCGSPLNTASRAPSEEQDKLAFVWFSLDESNR